MADKRHIGSKESPGRSTIAGICEAIFRCGTDNDKFSLHLRVLYSGSGMGAPPTNGPGVGAQTVHGDRPKSGGG